MSRVAEELLIRERAVTVDRWGMKIGGSPFDAPAVRVALAEPLVALTADAWR